MKADGEFVLLMGLLELRKVSAGDMFYWAYTIDFTPSGDREEYRFKDYMWMLSDDRVLQSIYVKWGIPLGESFHSV